jgi:hypothetical protein
MTIEEYYLKQARTPEKRLTIGDSPRYVGVRQLSMGELPQGLHLSTNKNIENDSLNIVNDNKLILKENQYKNDKQLIVNNFVENGGNKDEIINYTEKCEISLTHTKTFSITHNDYESLSIKESIRYDNRDFKTFLIDQIKQQQRIISLIYKVSLMDPFFLRINKLVFELSMSFAMSAIVFSDTYIDERAVSDDRVR